MRNRFYIAIMLILIPLAVFAQASGGQIRRHSHTQQTEHGNVNRQRTANHYNRDNAQPKRSLPTGKVNGYDAIDLGLSVRWATSARTSFSLELMTAVAPNSKALSNRFCMIST